MEKETKIETEKTKIPDVKKPVQHDELTEAEKDNVAGGKIWNDV